VRISHQTRAWFSGPWRDGLPPGPRWPTRSVLIEVPSFRVRVGVGELTVADP
jgi:hypothetical protein